MAKVTTSITLDPDLKQAAQELFNDLGLDLSSAITVFFKQALREQGMPFKIQRDNTIPFKPLREGNGGY